MIHSDVLMLRVLVHAFYSVWFYNMGVIFRSFVVFQHARNQVLALLPVWLIGFLIGVRRAGRGAHNPHGLTELNRWHDPILNLKLNLTWLGQQVPGDVCTQSSERELLKFY